MTDDPKPDALQQLAAAAAAVVVAGQGTAAVRELADRINSDERTAARVGRLVAGALNEWLRRPPA
jgi:hypothetical protein